MVIVCTTLFCCFVFYILTLLLIFVVIIWGFNVWFVINCLSSILVVLVFLYLWFWWLWFDVGKLLFVMCVCVRFDGVVLLCLFVCCLDCFVSVYYLFYYLLFFDFEFVFFDFDFITIFVVWIECFTYLGVCVECCFNFVLICFAVNWLLWNWICVSLC